MKTHTHTHTQSVAAFLSIFFISPFLVLWNYPRAIKFYMVTCLQYIYFDIQSVLKEVGTLGNHNRYLSHQTPIDTSRRSGPHYS